jgi:uncharacterized membrane protein
MPYCNQCGTQVQPTDRFCAKCGGAQPGPAPGGTAASDFLSGINTRTASLLCYIPVVGWLWAIVVLAAARFRHDTETRFNAFQGLYLFVAWLLVDWVVGPMFIFPMPHDFGLRMIPKLLKVAVLGGWIFMIIKTAHGESYRLPIIGELADRSVSEQR